MLMFQVVSNMHIPYNKFQIRFVACNCTTYWQMLEVGIAAECTILVVWFVIVMEILLKSIDVKVKVMKHNWRHSRKLMLVM